MNRVEAGLRLILRRCRHRADSDRDYFGSGFIGFNCLNQDFRDFRIVGLGLVEIDKLSESGFSGFKGDWDFDEQLQERFLLTFPSTRWVAHYLVYYFYKRGMPSASINCSKTFNWLNSRIVVKSGE